MYSYSFYPEHQVIFIYDSGIFHPDHFNNLFHSIIEDAQFDGHYDIIYDSRRVDWKNSNVHDLLETIDYIHDNKHYVSTCVCIVVNSGQIAYMDTLLGNTERFKLRYCVDAEEACELLGIPESVVIKLLK